MKPGLTLLLGLALVAGGCRKAETFPPIGDNMASPTDIAMSDDGEYIYALNADFDRTYNAGSIVTMDKDGAKQSAVELPRMGRALAVGGPTGTDLIATVDVSGDDYHTLPYAYLYDIGADPKTPQLKAKLELPFTCGPWGVSMRKGYKHFAVTCLDGTLMLGTLADDRSQSTLVPVRQFGVPRRAVYIDPKRELLLAFPTDPGKGATPDTELADTETHDQVTGLLTAAKPNEVPDSLENNKRVLSNANARETFQFVVYDIAAERAKGFPFVQNPDPTYAKELRWIYFRLANFDGTPDKTTYYNYPSYRFYHTNFYDVQPDPDDPDTFYLSHRGAPNISPWANDVVKVSFTGDLHSYASTKDGRDFPMTSDVLSFQRVYGFKGAQASKFAYPGAIKVAKIDGQKILLVNNFRDLVNWVRGDAYFSVAAQTLNDNESWYAEEAGGLAKNDARTYYQLAVSPSGRVASCSFYGNSVILLDIHPGVGITYLHPVQ